MVLRIRNSLLSFIQIEYYCCSRDAHIDFPGKFGYVLINHLASILNSTVHYNYVNTWGYGDMRHPKKLKGMMGHLTRSEIDIAGNFEQNQIVWMKKIRNLRKNDIFNDLKIFDIFFRHYNIYHSRQTAIY